jgi:hypothetical protein
LLNYPVIKRCVRFYRFKFLGLDEPIEVEATYRKEARMILNEIISQTPDLINRPIIGETVTLPLFGETIKEINDVEYVWVGFDNTQSGWMKLEDYERAEKK